MSYQAALKAGWLEDRTDHTDQETYTAQAGSETITGTLHECVCWADTMMMQGAAEVTIRRGP